MKKKFIMVQDSETATKLLSSGFQLVSQVNGTYTFINEVPQRFNFSEVDAKKLAYTDILTL